MKTVAAFICIFACSTPCLSQYVIKGSVDKVGNHHHIFLYKVTGIHNDLLIDSISLLPNKTFHFEIKNAPANGLYKLSIAEPPTRREFPEKAFLFIADSSMQLELKAASVEELYKSEIIQDGEVNAFIGEQLQKRLSVYFNLVQQFDAAITPGEKDYLFKQLLLFQEEWLGDIQSAILTSNNAGILIGALYFLAKIQHASGEGDFARYFNLVKMYLDSTDLTRSFFEYNQHSATTMD